jgi:hypothetical protein
MTRHTVAAGVAGALMTALAAGGCTDSKSILHVAVTGDVEGIVQLLVDISAGGVATRLNVPATPRPITLPTSFNVEMEHSKQGRLVVDIMANDENATPIATGSGELDAIAVGSLNLMTIALAPVGPPGGEPDGGGQPDGEGSPDGGGGEDGGGSGADGPVETAGGDDGGSPLDGGVVDDAGQADAADDAVPADDAGDDVSGAEAGP